MPSQANINLNVRILKPSATLAINEYSVAQQKQGKTIYKLGFGQSPFPVPDFVVKELQDHAFQKDYLPVKGLPELRQAVADFHQRKLGLDCEQENVMIGPGSKELMFIMQMAYPCELLLPGPSWVSYAPQAKLLGLPIHWMPTRASDSWRLQPEALERVCKIDSSRPRILVLNYPGNPTGVSYPKELLQELAALARKYQLIVLSDEIYGELNHLGEHVSIAKYYPEGTIISNGLSKWCGAGGWRLGTFVFPKELQWFLDAMAVIATETFSATAAPIQYAAIKAFQYSPDLEDYLKKGRYILRSLGNYVAKKLQESQVNVVKPEGAFYLFPDFGAYREGLNKKGIFTSEDLCQQLLKDTCVALLPGSDFGRNIEDLTARLAYVDFDGKQLLNQVQLDNKELMADNFIQENCKSLDTSIELICSWLNTL